MTLRQLRQLLNLHYYGIPENAKPPSFRLRLNSLVNDEPHPIQNVEDLLKSPEVQALKLDESLPEAITTKLWRRMTEPRDLDQKTRLTFAEIQAELNQAVPLIELALPVEPAIPAAAAQAQAAAPPQQLAQDEKGALIQQPKQLPTVKVDHKAGTPFKFFGSIEMSCSVGEKLLDEISNTYLTVDRPDQKNDGEEPFHPLTGIRAIANNEDGDFIGIEPMIDDTTPEKSVLVVNAKIKDFDFKADILKPKAPLKQQPTFVKLIPNGKKMFLFVDKEVFEIIPNDLSAGKLLFEQRAQPRAILDVKNLYLISYNDGTFSYWSKKEKTEEIQLLRRPDPECCQPQADEVCSYKLFYITKDLIGLCYTFATRTEIRVFEQPELKELRRISLPMSLTPICGFETFGLTLYCPATKFFFLINLHTGAMLGRYSLSQIFKNTIAVIPPALSYASSPLKILTVNSRYQLEMYSLHNLPSPKATLTTLEISNLIRRLPFVYGNANHSKLTQLLKYNPEYSPLDQEVVDSLLVYYISPKAELWNFSETLKIIWEFDQAQGKKQLARSNLPNFKTLAEEKAFSYFTDEAAETFVLAYQKLAAPQPKPDEKAGGPAKIEPLKKQISYCIRTKDNGFFYTETQLFKHREVLRLYQLSADKGAQIIWDQLREASYPDRKNIIRGFAELPNGHLAIATGSELNIIDPQQLNAENKAKVMICWNHVTFNGLDQITAILPISANLFLVGYCNGIALINVNHWRCLDKWQSDINVYEDQEFDQKRYNGHAFAHFINLGNDHVACCYRWASMHDSSPNKHDKLPLMRTLKINGNKLELIGRFWIELLGKPVTAFDRSSILFHKQENNTSSILVFNVFTAHVTHYFPNYYFSFYGYNNQNQLLLANEEDYRLYTISLPAPAVVEVAHPAAAEAAAPPAQQRQAAPIGWGGFLSMLGRAPGPQQQQQQGAAAEDSLYELPSGNGINL